MTCNTKQFWSSVKRFGDTGNNVSATMIDGQSNYSDINNVFVEKYKKSV